jgi:NADH-quinone oxidoreductase subunit K
MTPTLQIFLIVSAALFSIGLLAALSRRHAIFILIGIEISWQQTRFLSRSGVWSAPQPPTGIMIAFFYCHCAAEALLVAMVIAVYRHYHTTNVDQLDQLRDEFWVLTCLWLILQRRLRLP